MIIPDNFEVKEKLLTATGRTMKIKANGTKIGQIKQTHVVNGRQFQLINAHDELISIARKHTTPYGSCFEIYDQLNNKIGMVQRYLYKTDPLSEKYVIKNAGGFLIAETPQLAQICNAADFYDTMKIKIAEMRHGTSKMSRTWDVNLFGNFDRRLLIFLPEIINSELDIKCMTQNDVIQP